MRNGIARIEQICTRKEKQSMSKIKIINDRPENWYKCGEIYEVRDCNTYEGIGVQVYRTGYNGTIPDVVAEGDYEFVD